MHNLLFNLISRQLLEVVIVFLFGGHLCNGWDDGAGSMPNSALRYSSDKAQLEML